MRLHKLLAAALLLAAWKTARTTPSVNSVVFSKQSKAGMPTTFGHLSFSITKSQLHEKFIGHARRLFVRYMEVLDHRTAATCRVEDHLCHLNDVLTNNGTSAIYATEIANLYNAICAVTEDMLAMVFGDSIGTREKRELLEFIFQAVNFGITLKNSYDIECFRTRLQTDEDRIEALIKFDDEIGKTLLRDHHMIEKLANSTGR